MLKSGAVWALGAMSGTSLDGVDAAMVLTDGETVQDFGPHAYRAYTTTERAVLRRALGQWQDGPDVAAVADVIHDAHVEVLAQFQGVDLVGFHGQTLAHDPGKRGTHQAGDGGRLARALGVPVAWDFRSADVAMGGQGAPLVPYFHHALARRIGAKAPVAFLNLGGVGNVTWVDPRQEKPESQGAVLAFDTGPANAPINDLMAARGAGEYDKGGALAATGHADGARIANFLAHPYFMRIPPKSLDRNDFHNALPVDDLPLSDAAATLTTAIAASVIRGFDHFPEPVSHLLVTGGGRLNATLMGLLAHALPMPVAAVEQVGLNGDMLEAQAFAYLAVRVARGLPTSGPETTGVAAHVGGGRISQP